MILEGNESFPFFMMKTQSNVALVIMNADKSTLTVKEKTVNDVIAIQNRIDNLRFVLDDEMKKKESLIRLYNDQLLIKGTSTITNGMVKRFTNSILNEMEYSSERLSAGNQELKKLMSQLVQMTEG